MDTISTQGSRTKREPIYSLQWAENIVMQSLESHARGWEIVLKFGRVEVRWLIFLLACNDPAWYQIKRLAKIAENWTLRTEKFGNRLAWNKHTWLELCQAAFKGQKNNLFSFLTEQKFRSE